MGSEKEITKELRGEIEKIVTDRYRSVEEHVRDFQSRQEQAAAQLREDVRHLLQQSTELEGIIQRTVEKVTHRATDELKNDLTRDRIAAFANLNSSIVKIRHQQTQADILAALLEGASFFAPRVALFISRGHNIMGWDAYGFSGAFRNELIKTVMLPRTLNTLLREALDHCAPMSGSVTSNPDNHHLIEKFGPPEPKRLAAVPLVVNHKSVAVIYADSGDGDGGAVNIEALEVLVQVTSLTVESLARGAIKERAPGRETPTRVAPTGLGTAPRPTAPVAPAPRPSPTSPPAWAEPRVAEPAISETPARPEPARIDSRPAAVKAEPEVSKRPQPAEPAAMDTLTAPAVEPPPFKFKPGVGPRAPVEEIKEEPTHRPLPEELFGKPAERPVEPVKEEPAPLRSSVVAVEEPQPAPAARATPEIKAEPKSELKLQPKTPTWPPEEEKAHSEAKRCARLVVTEIRMYNEQKVLDGRRTKDLYTRLKQEIDRGREWYDKRVSSKVRSQVDYFHDYLVQILGENDPAALGSDYPGPKIEPRA